MQTETLETGMYIRDNSQELIKQAIITLPETPPYGWLTFISNGIEEPRWKKIEREQQKETEIYIKECSKARVIPFSEITMKYNVESGLFVPEAQSGGRIIHRNKDSIEAFLNGGKFHRIILETHSPYFDSRGFESLKAGFLQTLMNKGYHIFETNFWLTFYHHTGYEAGDSGDTTLGFNKNGLHLRIGSEISEEYTERLKNWFQELRNYKNPKLF